MWNEYKSDRWKNSKRFFWMLSGMLTEIPHWNKFQQFSKFIVLKILYIGAVFKCIYIHGIYYLLDKAGDIRYSH